MAYIASQQIRFYTKNNYNHDNVAEVNNFSVKIKFRRLILNLKTIIFMYSKRFE